MGRRNSPHFLPRQRSLWRLFAKMHSVDYTRVLPFARWLGTSRGYAAGLAPATMHSTYAYSTSGASNRDLEFYGDLTGPKPKPGQFIVSLADGGSVRMFFKNPGISNPGNPNAGINTNLFSARESLKELATPNGCGRSDMDQRISTSSERICDSSGIREQAI
jgi:hypothetical protein